MTAPQRRAGGFDANARGLAVLAAAVLIGFLLLLKAGGGETVQATDTGKTTVDTSGLSDEDTTTTAVEDTTTTSSEPTDEARDPAEVKVIVLNGSGMTGVAKSNSETIGEKGYDMLTPGNAASNVSLTVVYYAEGYQADAVAVAEVLGKSSDVVEAMPSTSPGTGADEADVVVVLGADTAPASSSTTGSSTTTTTG